jgi:hypothetical protein
VDAVLDAVLDAVINAEAELVAFGGKWPPGQPWMMAGAPV